MTFAELEFNEMGLSHRDFAGRRSTSCTRARRAANFNRLREGSVRTGEIALLGGCRQTVGRVAVWADHVRRCAEQVDRGERV